MIIENNTNTFILDHHLECFGTEVQGGPGHVPLGSCHSQGVRHQGGLPGRSGMDEPWGADKSRMGEQHLTEVSFLDRMPGSQE